MSRSSAHTWLFCELCGTMLSFDSPTYASCSFCNAQHDVKDFQGREIWYTLGAEDMIRRLGIEPLIKPESDPKVVKSSEEIQQRAMVNDECPKCKHPHLEYYTRQLRSADEGQTVFYECPNCHYKFSQNM
ncbi:hypothetical protein O6H91_10G059500 [Diphasiastrum complanatum]|uniref:Uncharacterized protein n=1 Tax=Diphasiastrum complanatum TaxID=34168 RepID=A0ACC2CHB1_DIPCM|nr:hypothetical protein O6H91_10G059500 [Diphasiastrum complanatum]